MLIMISHDNLHIILVMNWWLLLSSFLWININYNLKIYSELCLILYIDALIVIIQYNIKFTFSWNSLGQF